MVSSKDFNLMVIKDKTSPCLIKAIINIKNDIIHFCYMYHKRTIQYCNYIQSSYFFSNLGTHIA